MQSQGALGKDEFGQKLGERLRALREKKGISLREFETFDESMDRHALSRIENGQTVPNTYTLYRILFVIGVPMSELFKEMEK
jgi:transcriptional regulator with XRE-family HTH domain